jgi:hypothetical protein
VVAARRGEVLGVDGLGLLVLRVPTRGYLASGYATSGYVTFGTFGADSFDLIGLELQRFGLRPLEDDRNVVAHRAERALTRPSRGHPEWPLDRQGKMSADE